MARITVEDALEQAENRFALTILAAQRVRQLFRGSKPMAEKKGNREVVTALREIAEGKVRYAYPEHLRLIGTAVKQIEAVDGDTDRGEEDSE